MLIQGLKRLTTPTQNPGRVLRYISGQRGGAKAFLGLK